MEQIGGRATPSRGHHHRRFLPMLPPQPPSASTPIELSEDDIFTAYSTSPTRRSPITNPSSAQSIHRNHYGILAALNGNIKSRSESGHNIQPVFNQKAFDATSLSSSPSASPATLLSHRITIPRPPPTQAGSARVYHQSAPVDIPAMTKELGRSAVELEEAVSEEEDEKYSDVRLPPHEVVASRYSPLLACSMLEGNGRTLKGRDLRQVRSAVWRKTGFID